MNDIRRDGLITAVALILGLVFDRFWFLPYTIAVPLVVTYATRQPFWYLVITALPAVFLNTTVPAVVLAAIFTPWLWRRVWPAVAVDVSFSYLALLALSAVTTLLLLIAPDVAGLLRDGVSLPAALARAAALPAMLTVLTATTVTAFAVTVILHFNYSSDA